MKLLSIIILFITCQSVYTFDDKSFKFNQTREIVKEYLVFPIHNLRKDETEKQPQEQVEQKVVGVPCTAASPGVSSLKRLSRDSPSPWWEFLSSHSPFNIQRIRVARCSVHTYLCWMLLRCPTGSVGGAEEKGQKKDTGHLTGQAS